MTRYLACLLTLTILALVACTPSAQPAQAPAQRTASDTNTAVPVPTAVPTLVLPTLDRTRLPRVPDLSPDPSQNARTIKEWFRQETGLREQLGPETDELFRLMDQAESEALRDVLDQLKTRGKPKGMPAPLPPRRDLPLGAEQFEAFANAHTALSDVPELISRPEYREPDGPLPAKESTKEIGENIRAFVKVQPSVTGCHAELDVQVTIRAEKDGVVYEDKAKGHISMTICPDAEGKVPLNSTIDTEINIKDVHLSLSIVDHAIGHVDDEGNLASIDAEIEAELDIPTGKNWFTGGNMNSSARVNFQLSRSGFNSANSQDIRETITEDKWLDASFPPNPEVAVRAAVMGKLMAQYLQDAAFKKAEKKWQDNYCVAITGVDESQYVLIGSETPFTASVRHQWEGKDLSVPVIATLTEGAVSVAASGTKVPAPATFRYNAPKASTFHPSIVELVSRSRRGIGKLNVTFHIREEYYEVNQIVENGRGRLSGSVCALDKPFTLNIEGQNAGLGKFVGDFQFTPKNASGGTWKHRGTTTCLPELGCGTVEANGTYQVEGQKEGKPELVLNKTTQTSRVGGQGGTSIFPGLTIDLKPSTGICAPE